MKGQFHPRLAAAAALGLATAGRAEDRSAPLGIHVEPSTLHCLGVRWPIKGDRNRNAVIEVRFRGTGGREWKKGYPLSRTLPNPHAENRSAVHTLKGGWVFAGSIVGLRPDSEYEVKLTLKDPDGGRAERTFEKKTYAEPEEPEGVIVRHVVPGNGGYDESRHHYITDNVFEGPTAWPRRKGIESYCAVYMSGAGHVVAYNLMRRLGDGIHGTSHGYLSASDWHNNDITICTDDGLETDEAEFNVRVYHNRILNVAHGVTAQPSRGGPIYIFRNLIYNATYSPFKLHNHTTGVLIFHNTCFKSVNGFNIVPAQETVTNVVTRNNLFLCRKGRGLFVETPNMRFCDFDNDGYGGYDRFARWNRRKRYKTVDDAKKGGEIYAKLGAVRVRSKTCFASGLLPPAEEGRTYEAEETDARLAEKSDAIDRGVVLPNFSDGFTGRAPDLGAFEFGKPLPHFGPRPVKEEGGEQ